MGFTAFIERPSTCCTECHILHSETIGKKYGSTSNVLSRWGQHACSDDLLRGIFSFPRRQLLCSHFLSLCGVSLMSHVGEDSIMHS